MSFENINVNTSLVVQEHSESSANPLATAETETSGLFLYPSRVTGRSVIAGLPVSALNARGKLTYSVQGTVSQATSISTGVTLNAQFGRITTQAADANAAGATTNTFTVTNSYVNATSVVLVSYSGYGGAGVPTVAVGTIADGSFTVTIENAGADDLNNTMVIHFQVLA